MRASWPAPITPTVRVIRPSLGAGRRHYTGAVRALLMYSTRFRVIFSGSLFARERREMVAEVQPLYLRNPGSALWLKVV